MCQAMVEVRRLIKRSSRLYFGQLVRSIALNSPARSYRSSDRILRVMKSRMKPSIGMLSSLLDNFSRQRSNVIDNAFGCP